MASFSEIVIPVVLYGGAVQGVLLAVFLAGSSRDGSLANRLLAGVLVLVSAGIGAGHLVSFDPSFRTWHDAYRLGMDLVLLLEAALIQWYVRAVTEPGFRLGWRQSVWLAPVLCAGLAIGAAEGWTGGVAAGLPSETGPLHALLSALTAVFMLVTLGLSLVRLRAYGRLIRRHFSSLQRLNRAWLAYALASFGLIFALGYLTDIFKELTRADLELWEYVSLLLAVNLYVIGWIALRRPAVFSSRAAAELQADGDDPAPAGDSAGGEDGDSASGWGRERSAARTGARGGASGGGKYQNSSLGQAEIQTARQRLEAVMAAERPYLDSALTLGGLARRLGMKPHDLSRVINQTTGGNFFELVNSRRIEEACRRLSDPALAHLTIASIAFDVGFNTLSAFNAAFRKQRGQTPSRFRGAKAD